MNIAHLFLLQSELDAHIEESHPRLEGESRHDKKVLALLTELGELANEARFFKFWSNNQKPRIIKRVDCFKCSGTGYGQSWLKNCPDCNGSGKEKKNPLLEEFVDGIHFLLSIGLENSIEELNIKAIKKHTLTEQFLDLYSVFSLMYVYFTPKCYSKAWSAYVGLAEMLGFTWSELEAAYLAKNEKNHKRQQENY